MSVVKCVGQVALRKLGFERFPSGVGKHRTQDVRKSGSKCAHNPGGVGRTSAGSGPRIYLGNIFLERGLKGTGGKSPVHTFSQERNALGHGELKPGSLIVVDLRPGKVLKNFLQATAAERRTEWLLLLHALPL